MPAGGRCEVVEGNAELRTGEQFVEAVGALQKATVIGPSNDQAFYNMAVVHMEMRKFDPAKEDLTRAISVSPENAAYQEKLGTVLIDSAPEQVRLVEMSASMFFQDS